MAIAIETLIGSQLSKAEYRLGTLDLQSLSEIEPLNQQFEALVLRCGACGAATAFLSLQTLDKYIDVEKNSTLQCRHCQYERRIPKISAIRETQGGPHNFLQVEGWHSTKILSKKGQLIQVQRLVSQIKLKSIDPSERSEWVVELPRNKRKLLATLRVGQKYRFKAKILESKSIDARKSFLQKSSQASPTLKTQRKYQLLSLSKL